MTVPVRKIRLTSQENEVFEVDRDVVSSSNMLTTMITDLGLNDKEGPIDVPLEKISSSILRKVLQWCEHHKDDVPATAEVNAERPADYIPQWDQEFIDVDQGMLFDLILAANFLDIKGLLDIACKSVANMIKGKTPEDIRRTFNIKNDLTPAEEEQIRKENAWCED